VRRRCYDGLVVTQGRDRKRVDAALRAVLVVAVSLSALVELLPWMPF
jgi:hypothetical protein